MLPVLGVKTLSAYAIANLERLLTWVIADLVLAPSGLILYTLVYKW